MRCQWGHACPVGAQGDEMGRAVWWEMVLGFLLSVNLLFQTWGSPAFAAHFSLLRPVQDPQTHCAPHLASKLSGKCRVWGV